MPGGAPCCCSGGAPGCGCARLPSSVTVEIEGVINGDVDCTDCAEVVNGSYVVDIDPETCQGIVEMIGPDCFDYSAVPENFWILVQIFDRGGPSFEVDVKITDGDAPESFRETGDISGADCCAVSGRATTEYFSPVPDCDWSGATVTVTLNCE